MEAIIDSSANYVNTYYLADTQIDAKLTNPQAAIDIGATPSEQTTDYDFIGTSWGDALTLTEETPSSPEHFKSFKVANCTLTTVKMDCTNWVIKAASESTTDGLVNWSSGNKVKFWWFDGRRYKDNSLASDVIDGSDNNLWVAKDGSELNG